MCDIGLLWKFDAPDAMTALRERPAFLEALRRHPTWQVDEQAAKVLFTELVANVARHGNGPISVWLYCARGFIKFHVLEFGPGFTMDPTLAPPFSESGRGLYLVAVTARDLKIEGDPRGTHIIATIPHANA